MASIPSEVLVAYGFKPERVEARSFGTGLINHTWKVQTAEAAFILQTINQNVFPDPPDIANNIDAVGDYLKQHEPEYYFVRPVKTLEGNSMVFSENQYFRMFPFVKGSHAKTVVGNASEAFEAAKQFGNFTRLLSGFETKSLHITLPDFHNLTLRYKQFEEALINGDQDRINASKNIIKELQFHSDIVRTYQSILLNPDFKQRSTHHDTKISNVLFNDANEGICVIDLDTLMPGYFISDVGDMMRTYLCPVSEEEKDFAKIEIRIDFYHAIVKGYSEAMSDELTETEKQYFFYAGKFMIYMQALRFLTDHLNNDCYYGARYEGQNYIRAGNQMMLLEKLIAKGSMLQ
jgi:Ser/Thr protein kinase RdoA (MazF antagonist)